MFSKTSQTDYIEVAEGMFVKGLSYGGEILSIQYKLVKGTVHKMHSHDFEQTGYLLTGKARLTMDGVDNIFEAGDSYSCPAGVAHEAEALEDIEGVEFFSEVREDYMPFFKK